LIGLFSVHEAVVPPFVPVQDQRYCVAESVASTYVPAVQVLLVVPQTPLTGAAVHIGVALISLLATLSPIVFFAYTRNIYSVPFSRPVMVAVRLSIKISPS
jgi:hypothetical protein